MLTQEQRQVQIAIDQLRDAFKKTELDNRNIFDRVLNSLQQMNRTLNKMHENSNLIVGMNTLTSSFITMSHAITSSASKVLEVIENDRWVIFANPALAAGGTGNLYFGNAGVTTSSGYPLIAGMAYPFYVKRNTEIWAVSNTTATLNMILF